MRRVAKTPRPTGAKKPDKVSPAKIRDLRETAKAIREQVANDSDQIAAEGRAAIADAVASGRLTKLTLLLRPDEQTILDALDRYAADHGLKSRNQVLRAALAHLLNVDLDQPHWGWPAGKPRA
jgi:hypothetical protein